ncbi:MAG: hypothetical protein ACXWC2_12220 [Ramlibacter sp.]
MDTDAPEQVGAGWEAAMRAGDWEAAWRHTDRIELARRRAQRQPGFERAPHHLVWDGSGFDGRSVLVRCEHGLGDTLQFSRFLPALAARARELHVMAQPHLLRLLRPVPGIGQVHDGWAGPDWPPHELEVEVMELAYALRATPASVPPPLPFARHLAPMRGLDDGSGRLKVGLLWAASDWDPSRSVPWPALEPLLALPGARFFSLQQGPAALAAERAGWPVEPLWRRTGEVADAAAAMLALDLVVAVDGMPVHLAGSLGRPTWVLLKHHADWRWGAGTHGTPWYPALRLFRQARPGDWHGAVAQVIQALRALPVAPTTAIGARLPHPGRAMPTIP